MPRSRPLTADKDGVRLLRNNLRARDRGEHPPRSSDRHQPDGVECPLGEVVDMSGTGMRLRMRKKPPVLNGQVLVVQLAHPEGTLAVKGQVRWWRKTGLRRYEVGLKFVRVTDGAMATLEAIAMGRRMQRKRPTGAPADWGQAGPIAAKVSLPNYYGILGLRPEADAAAIKRRYRQLAARLHPDVNPDADALVRFERLTEAYRVLSDTRRREAYLSLIA